MKKINELRITNALNYIKDYYRAHGMCPTYRQIMDDLNYSSLSLVSSDINRLKERGELVDDGFSHIQLSSAKNEHIRRYDYPFLIMTDANYNEDCLNGEEKKLLEAQNEYLKGNYDLAKDISRNLLETSSDKSVSFGARLTLCWCGIYTGEVDYWKDFFRLMIRYESLTVSEKMEKELMAHFLMSTLGNNDNCPDWLKEGRFYDLRQEAYPLALLLFVSRTVSSDSKVSPFYLEPMCSAVSINRIDICQVYMDLYLASAYHYSGNDKYMDSHLEAAVKTCLKRGWLTPLAEVKKSLGSVINPLLDEETSGQVDKLNETLTKGYNKIYEVLVGENPIKNLSFREVEIINYVRQDYSTKEIADKLYLSPDTIKYYLSSIYLKLDVSGRKELKELIRKSNIK